MSFPISITAEALKLLRRMLQREVLEGQFVRIGVKGGGCSGFEYVIKLDTRRLPIDLETQLDDVLVVCDSKSAKMLQGATLTTTNNLIGGGLIFDNPNAERACGCGSSFTLKN